MFITRLAKLKEVVEACIYTTKKETLVASRALHLAHALLIKTKNQGGKVYVIGNGGSAGIASHFAIDLLNALKIPASTLYDSNQMTCIANDYGYEYVFSNPLQTLIKPIDLLVAISSSGKSKNIINAVEVAKNAEAYVITLSGFAEDNPLRKMGELNFYLNVDDYGLVETGHFFLLHTIIDSWKSSAALHEKSSIAIER